MTITTRTESEIYTVTVMDRVTRTSVGADGSKTTTVELVPRLEKRVRTVVKTIDVPDLLPKNAFQLYSDDRYVPSKVAGDQLTADSYPAIDAGGGGDGGSVGTGTSPTLDPERKKAIEDGVSKLRFASDVVEVIDDLELNPDEQAYAVNLAIDRIDAYSAADGTELAALAEALKEHGATDPDGAMAVSIALADRAFDPAIAGKFNPGDLAAAAMQVALGAQGGVQSLLNHLASSGKTEAFLGTLGLEVNSFSFDNPRSVNSGSRRMDLVDFLDAAKNLPPSEAQASFFLTAFKQAGALAWGDSSFRTVMGRGLASVFALGDRALAASEGDRLAGLLDNGTIAEAMQQLAPADREKLMLTLMQSPNLTSALLDDHHGNLATAVAEAQLAQVTTLLSAPFTGGTIPLGPDGKPIIAPDATLVPPDGFDLSAYPKIAALKPPITEASLQQAIASGSVSNKDVAAYLHGLANRSRAIGDPDLTKRGADWFTAAMIGLFNGGNPITESHLDRLATNNANALDQLANAIAASNDPAFIAQAAIAGNTQNQIFDRSLHPYADAIAAMGDRVQRNRVITMAVVGIVASIAAPIMISAGLPAFGATGTILGMSVTGSPFLSAALPAAATAVLSTTTNAAFQYEGTGSVSWGNAILAGAADGLTSFFGATLAARAMERGYGFLRTVGTAGAINAAGGFASYVLGTPGALSAILGGDAQQLDAALGRAGLNFLIAVGVNGALYRINAGDVPPLGRSVDHAANEATMGQILAEGEGSIFDGSVPVRGLNGETLDPTKLTGAASESYFAVYRNTKTGELIVQEVARARPGQPMALEPFDIVQGVKRNSPGEGWQAVGGFHTHAGGGGTPSAFDLAMEPVFRGELGSGFSSYTLGTNGARPFINATQAPVSLADAYRLGMVRPLSSSMLEGEALPSNWKSGLEALIEDNSRGLNAIIADPNTPPAVKTQAMADMEEMYRRFGRVIEGATASTGALTAEGRVQLSELNDWLVESMPKYQSFFQATVQRGLYRWGQQVSPNNGAAQSAVEMQLLFSSELHFTPTAWLNGVRSNPDSAVYVVGIANGGGGPAAGLWTNAVEHGFDPQGGELGVLVPTARTGNAASSYALTLNPPPKPGDTIVIVDDLFSAGNTGRAAIDWVQKNYPGVNVRFVAPGASGTYSGVTLVDWSAVYAPPR